jgi:hypothetical protein
VRRRLVSVAVVALSVALAATIGLAVVGGDAVWYLLVWGVPVISAATIGLLLRSRVPANPIGWLFVIVGSAEGLGIISEAYAVHVPPLPGALAAAVAANLLEPLPLLLLPALLLVFPDGRLPSRRWRPVVVLWGVAVAGIGLQIIVGAGEMSNYSGSAPTNPLGIGGGGGTIVGVVSVIAFYPLLVPITIAAAVSLVRRFRGATGDLRQQLKWFVAASVLLAATVVAGPLGLWTPWNGNLWLVVWALGLSLLVAATGIAILRYRLYEIDRLISRTLAYTIVTGLLAAVFFGLVILTTRVLPLSSPVGVAASTLAAAALVNPLRRRVQHLVDRRFNRARYDAEATVAAFTAQLRDAVDLDAVQGGLVDVVARAVQPAHTSLWIRPKR